MVYWNTLEKKKEKKKKKIWLKLGDKQLCLRFAHFYLDTFGVITKTLLFKYIENLSPKKKKKK